MKGARKKAEMFKPDAKDVRRAEKAVDTAKRNPKCKCKTCKCG